MLVALCSAVAQEPQGDVRRVLEPGWALQPAVSWNSRNNWRIFHVV